MRETISWALFVASVVAWVVTYVRAIRPRPPVMFYGPNGISVSLGTLYAMAREPRPGWQVWISPACTVATVRFGDAPPLLFERGEFTSRWELGPNGWALTQ